MPHTKTTSEASSSKANVNKLGKRSLREQSHAMDQTNNEHESHPNNKLLIFREGIPPSSNKSSTNHLHAPCGPLNTSIVPMFLCISQK